MLVVFSKTFRLVYASFIIAILKCSSAEVYITDANYSHTIASFHSVSASFGKPLPDNGVRGAAVESWPRDACSAIRKPPSRPSNMSWIAIISRYGGCTFEEKVRNAMLSNYSAAIVYNIDSNKVILQEAIQMGGSDDSLIPSVFVGYSTGKAILDHFLFTEHPELRLVVTEDEPFDINAYLLPFAIVVGICFLIMLGIVIFKCIQDHRRRMRHRLPKSALKKLPIHKFKAGDPFETCCICLDDFEEGEKLRILPCDHGYHSKCIDSWLVKHKRICPQCRKRVFDRGSGYSSDEESAETNERAPLLAPRQGTSRASLNPTNGGTFSSRPSTSSGGGGILDRLQTPAEDEPRRLLQHRRFRRPRRLRRVYEVLSESTTSSDDDNDNEQLAHEQESHEAETNAVAAEVHVQVHEESQHAEEPSVIVSNSRSPAPQDEHHQGAESV